MESRPLVTYRVQLRTGGFTPRVQRTDTTRTVYSCNRQHKEDRCTITVYAHEDDVITVESTYIYTLDCHYSIRVCHNKTRSQAKCVLNVLLLIESPTESDVSSRNR